MKKWFFILISLNIIFLSYGQKIYWSDITMEDRKQAAIIIEQFNKCLSNQSYDSIPFLIMGNEININGDHPIPINDFLAIFQNQLNNATFKNQNMAGYTFEDFLENYKNNELIEKVYPVFNNHSILFHLSYNTRGPQREMMIVMKKNKAGDWKISGISGLDYDINGKSEKNWALRKETIPMAGISLYLPENFKMHDNSEYQVNFYMKGETERDAVLQVMIDDIQGKLHFYTYKFVEFNNQYNELSDLTVKYLPYGILYEYDVKDSYGTKNKGITAGLEHKGKFILIQYYSFHDIYEEMEQKIEYIFRNVIKE